MLDRVGLDVPDERLDQFPHRLSGGQRQRVLIAMAIAHAPAVLVADEPTSALDAALRHDIMALLRRLQRETAWRCCSSAMIWRAWRIMQTGCW
jgi:ABC-type dipeptide/oligopeptide/nickel transport system ATPase component